MKPTIDVEKPNEKPGQALGSTITVGAASKRAMHVNIVAAGHCGEGLVLTILAMLAALRVAAGGSAPPISSRAVA